MLNPGLASFLWTLKPHTFAEKVSRGTWKPYNYLIQISNKIVSAIGSGNGRLIVEVPPRHGKSELISFMTPAWFLNLFPDKNIIVCSYEAEFAAHWGRKTRNLIAESEHIDVKIRDDSSAANRFQTVQGGGMVTAGVGGPITGRGGDLIIIDDPVKNWQDAMSTTKRKTAIEWFNSTLYTRAEPGASILVLQTRWHEGDLSGYLQNEHTDNWEVIRYPALAEADDPLGRKPGEALCPERYNEAKLLQTKSAVGSRVWQALYQQRPTAEEGGLIKRDWLRYWQKLPELEETFQAWDLSFKGGADNDYTVGQLWGRIGADRYLIDQVRGKMDFPTQIQAVTNFSLKWPNATAKLIEDKANGSALIATLHQKIEGLIPYNPEVSKDLRLQMVSPIFESGNIYLPDPIVNHWVGDFVEELISFPNAAHDDQVDAATSALIRMQGLSEPRIWLLD